MTSAMTMKYIDMLRSHGAYTKAEAILGLHENENTLIHTLRERIQEE